MRRWICDSLTFLWVLGVLQLARLVVAGICVVQVLGVLILWGMAVGQCLKHDQGTYLLIPIGATFLMAIQVVLWHFAWPQTARRGGPWRTIAACFSKDLRSARAHSGHRWE